MGALVLLVVFSPVMILISVILFFSHKRVVFFKQMRPGKDEKPFLLYKFSTMKNDLPDDIVDDEKITWFGNILRKSSLDETPQLFHVLQGKMSIIGPRPLLMEYLPLYSEFQRKRHSVLPGLTGWAQVKGRNTIDWKERFELDVYYTENITFLMDAKIVLLTIFKAITARDVYDKNGRIVERFKGNSPNQS